MSSASFFLSWLFWGRARNAKSFSKKYIPRSLTYVESRAGGLIPFIETVVIDNHPVGSSRHGFECFVQNLRLLLVVVSHWLVLYDVLA